MKNQEIKTPNFSIWLGEDGIFRTQSMPGAVYTLDVAKENIAAIAKIAAGKKRPLLVYVGNKMKMNSEARLYLANKSDESLTAIALISDGAIARVIANFYTSISQQKVPTKMFNAEPEALQWLKKYIGPDKA